MPETEGGIANGDIAQRWSRAVSVTGSNDLQPSTAIGVLTFGLLPGWAGARHYRPFPAAADVHSNRAVTYPAKAGIQ